MDSHILVVGTPGNGKTTGIVMSTTVTWRGIQIIVDVKGNLYSHWKRLNKHTGKKIKIFRPCAPKGNSCRYDPYAPLRRGDVVGNARILALSLMPLMPFIKDHVWIQAAQNFLTGAIIYYFNNGYSFLDTMTQFQFTLISKMIDEIMEQDNMAAKSYIIKLKEVQVNVIGNIGMELSKLAALITDPAIINIFHTDAKRGLIDWADLNTRKKPFDIILEFPEADMERLEPLMKLMLNQLIKSLEQRPERTYDKGSELPPVLILLDEFPRLGNISAIENGLKTLRSRGVTFALFVQSFADLEKIYGPEAARVIADICSYKVILGATDPISQEYFSKAVGTIESTQKSAGINFNPFSGMFFGYGMNINETREPLIYPHEFLTLKNIVVINPHNGYCRVDKIMFHEH
jgi:type IV secretion system protein VirD4